MTFLFFFFKLFKNFSLSETSQYHRRTNHSTCSKLPDHPSTSRKLCLPQIFGPDAFIDVMSLKNISNFFTRVTIRAWFLYFTRGLLILLPLYIISNILRIAKSIQDKPPVHQQSRSHGMLHICLGVL